ncbi:MAG: thiol:disulfide interchange protein [Pseudohongiella sp.]|nr:MAG: thiol:disulfide interchange protein [Pseudohongiella sp.]
MNKHIKSPSRFAKNLLLGSCAALLSFSSLVNAADEGDSLPTFDLPSIHEGQANISSESLAGKTVFIDFWASWCAPCLKSLPLYNELHHKYSDQGFEVVAINVDNPIEDGLDWLLDTPLDFKIPSDPEGTSAELFEVIGMPTSYLVAPDGTIKLVHMGFRDGDLEIIEEEIQAVLAEQ